MAEEIKSVKLGDKEYNVADLTEKSIALINDVKRVEDEMGRLNIQMGIAKIARAKLLEELEKEKQNIPEIK